MHPMTKDVFTAISLLKPYDIDRPRRRVGNRRDGAYIMTDVAAGVDILSFGISNDIGFETEMANAGHRIFMFDHTIPALPDTHGNFHFAKIGIGGAGGGDPDLLSLDEHLQRIDDLSNQLILKIDVEGCEWEVFDSVSPATLSRFEQIVVEFHWLSRLSDGEFRRKVINSLRNLNQLFTLYHVHANNCCELHVVEGFAVADVLEISYIRSDLVTRRPTQTLYPTPLNCGNHPNAADLPLLFYPFLPTPIGDHDIGAMLDRVIDEIDPVPFV